MKILDCTLRDGGYYTNWDFEDDIVKNYIQSFNNLPVDYLEIGYRSNPMQTYYGQYFYSPISTLKKINKLSNKKIAIILNEKDVSASEATNLLEPIIDYVSMVRLAIDPDNFERALSLAKVVKKLGFEVAFNVMYMSKWEDNKKFMQLIPRVNEVADYFYMVDSFGGVFPNDVKRLIGILKSQVTIKLGFHGHNNLEMALANTLTAIDEGIDIVDATVTGMGRGAGNLKTELLLTVLNSKRIVDFPYNDLSKTVDDFSKLQSQYNWGTNLPYIVSGANSLPQKQVMEWVTKRFYSFNSIIRALNNFTHGKKDNTRLPKLNVDSLNNYDSVLIVGGGNSVLKNSKIITEYLQSNTRTAVVHASSKNAMSFLNITNDQFFCLIGNEGHRLEKVFVDVEKVKGKCVLPPFPRKMGTYIPEKLIKKAYELNKISFTDILKNTHTSLAIETVIALKINKVFVVGYDGYSDQNIGNKEQELFAENEFLFKKAKNNSLELISLTSTKYNNLKKESIFAKI